MRYYARISLRDDTDAVKAIFAKAGIDTDEVIFDSEVQQKQSGSTYSKLKEELSQTHEPLTVDDMFSLGKNAREVTKELDWFVEHDIEIHILDLPSTMKNNAMPTEILRDVNGKYAEREVEKLKAGQKKSAREAKKTGREIKKSSGRPRIPYPANWNEEYDRWQDKEITSAEFMANVGLSQGTFYNLLRQYKEDLIKKAREENDEERETS